MGPRTRGRVLVVEDHGDTLELYCEVLTLAGYRCLTVASSRAAVRLATDEHFDAVVMDIGLPDRVDGLSLARALRALPEPPPMVALSGYPKDGDTDGLFAVELLKPTSS